MFFYNFIFFAVFAQSFQSMQKPITNRLWNYKQNYGRCISMSSVYGKQRVVVIGGGFGGLYAALEIDKCKSKDTEVILLDSKDKFVFLPLLYELAVGSASVAEVAPSYADILKASNITYIQSEVLEINIKDRNVVVKNKSSPSSVVSFDQCVIAVGTEPRENLIPGAAEYALPFYRVTDVYKLQTRLKELINLRKQNSTSLVDPIKISIIGAGYSGVELATNILDSINTAADGYPVTVSLIDRNEDIMHTAAPHNRDTARK